MQSEKRKAATTIYIAIYTQSQTQRFLGSAALQHFPKISGRSVDQ